MKKKQALQKPYSTLAEPGSHRHNYRDRDSLPYSVQYPLIEFLDVRIKIADNESLLHKQLLNNYWYQKSNTIERRALLNRIVHVNKNLQIVIDYFDKSYGKLGFTIEHISIAGSYAYATKPGDIDLDVIVKGSFFDYSTFNDGIEVLDLSGSVRKISLTVMGMDNVIGKAFTADDIHNEGFIHNDTIIREMLVAPMRNITIYGRPFDERKNTDSRNVLVRVARQLYFAELTLQGKIPYYEEEPLRSRKAVGRIREAYEIIDWLLNTSIDLHL